MAKKDHSRDIEFFAPWLVSSAPNASGEYRIKCPIHGDRNASASINFEKGVFSCRKPGCVGGSTVNKLKAMIHEREEHVEEASYDPFGTAGVPQGTVTDLAAKRAQKAAQSDDGEAVKELSEALARNFHDNLMRQPDLLDKFMLKRGLTVDTVKEYMIGFETKTKRFTIPVRDADGRLVNFRKYQLGDAGKYQKMINHLSYGSPARLYPLAVLEGSDNVIICEGELDAVIANQEGVTAVSGTAGAEKWMHEWSPLFEGKHVTIIYDNDQAGRLGSNRVKRSVIKYAASVKVIDELAPGDHEDVTDYFVKHGGSRRKLKRLISKTPTVEEVDSAEPSMMTVEPEVASVRVVDSMDASKNGVPLRLTATITGVKGPTRSVPREYVAYCGVEAGAKCKVCPMYLDHEGELRSEVQPSDLETMSLFMEKGAADRPEIIRQAIGAQKCNFLKVDVSSVYTAEELFVAASVDSMEPNEADYTHRRVYNIGESYDTKPNVVANLTGSTWPSPSTSRNEFFAWGIEPAVTSIDAFEMTPALKERLEVFQPEGVGHRAVTDKLRDIAVDRALNVTGILGRERMHMAMDLVFHSPLRYIWRGTESRGWLEMVVVGDTRTGKSVTARKLSDYYRLGHVISCEGATFAGLIGGNKQTNDQWMIQWGEYTINDRRLVVMDEVSGLSKEIIALMSDVRTSGEAQLNKIEHGRTTARVRSIWISNPRVDRYVDEKKTLGIDIVQDVIGNPEDIARFDIAMSVRETDVSAEAINSVFTLGQPRYTRDDSQALVLWVWSRKPDQVVFTDEAIQAVFDNAMKLSEMYVLTPGLIQLGNAHEKVSRLAAAVAARVFSTDVTGENIVVKPEHVQSACNFLHRLYSYDNFGYYSRSQRIVRNRSIAKENRERIRRWLRENPQVLEFLLDRKSSFRAGDLEEMAHLDRDEAKNAIWTLNEAKMVSKDKSQIILEPELQDLLQKGKF